MKLNKIMNSGLLPWVTSGRYATVVKIIAVCQIGCKHIDRFTVIVESFYNRYKNVDRCGVYYLLLIEPWNYSEPS